jgi:hypothetical protein
MLCEDEEITPVVKEGNNLPNKAVNFDDDNDEESFVSTMSAMLDSSNQDFQEKDEIITATVQSKFSGIPRSIVSLTKIFNPNPQYKWENIMGEAANFTHETTHKKAQYLIATQNLRLKGITGLS